MIIVPVTSSQSHLCHLLLIQLISYKIYCAHFSVYFIRCKSTSKYKYCGGYLYTYAMSSETESSDFTYAYAYAFMYVTMQNECISHFRALSPARSLAHLHNIYMALLTIFRGNERSRDWFGSVACLPCSHAPMHVHYLFSPLFWSHIKKLILLLLLSL